MQNKAYLFLYTMLLPFKSKLFLDKDQFLNMIESKKQGRNKLEDIDKKLNSLVWDMSMELKTYYNVRSIDEVKLCIEKYFGFLFKHGEVNNEVELYEKYFEILDVITKIFITHRDGKITYKYWANEGNDENYLGSYSKKHKIEVFYILSRFISIDLLIVNHLVLNGIDDAKNLNDYYYLINMADASLDDVLCKGVAENHVHLNATSNFSMSWMILMKTVFLEGKTFADDFFKFENSKKSYTYKAGIIRFLLANFLSCENFQFIDFLKSVRCNDGKNFPLALNDIIMDNAEDNKIKFFAQEVLKNNNFVNPIDNGGYINAIFNKNNLIKTYDENLFLFHALKYIRDNSADDLFIKYFMKYTVIKNQLYETMVQTDNIKGLTRFKMLYAAASTSEKFDSKEYWENLLRANFQNEYLKSFEGRVSIKNKEETFINSIKNMLTAYKDIIEDKYMDKDNLFLEDFPRFGIIFHFLKRNDIEKYEKCCELYDENKEKTYKYFAFEEYLKSYAQQLCYLKKIRKENPYLTQFLLGIDVASEETAMPVSVFSKLFSKARNSGENPLQQEINGDLIKIKSLSFTFHAGEDFRHLFTGLRSISEVIEYCKFHSGDRIGHGTALGIDIDYWAKENKTVIIPRGEHLDNLLWVWKQYTISDMSNPGVILYLESKILELAEAVYVNYGNITIENLFKAYKSCFEEYKKMKPESVFCLKGQNFNSKNMIWTSDDLAMSRNCKCYLEELLKPIMVETNETDISILKVIQRDLCKKVSSMGIVVEVNPSSNTVIGELESIYKHHAFKLNEPNSYDKNIILNVNSDDPSVFSTNVSNELAYLYYSISESKNSKEDVINWIDKLRKNGLETSFINNRISKEKYYEYLKKALHILDKKM